MNVEVMGREEIQPTCFEAFNTLDVSLVRKQQHENPLENPSENPLENPSENPSENPLENPLDSIRDIVEEEVNEKDHSGISSQSLLFPNQSRSDSLSPPSKEQVLSSQSKENSFMQTHQSSSSPNQFLPQTISHSSLNLNMNSLSTPTPKELSEFGDLNEDELLQLLEIEEDYHQPPQQQQQLPLQQSQSLQ